MHYADEYQHEGQPSGCKNEITTTKQFSEIGNLKRKDLKNTVQATNLVKGNGLLHGAEEMRHIFCIKTSKMVNINYVTMSAMLIRLEKDKRSIQSNL